MMICAYGFDPDAQCAPDTGARCSVPSADVALARAALARASGHADIRRAEVALSDALRASAGPPPPMHMGPNGPIWGHRTGRAMDNTATLPRVPIVRC